MTHVINTNEQSPDDKIIIDVEDFRNDKSPNSMYYSWQSSIAMAFYDEWNNTSDIPVIEPQLLLEIANNAAKNFLNNLCRKNEIPPAE